MNIGVNEYTTNVAGIVDGIHHYKGRYFSPLNQGIDLFFTS